MIASTGMKWITKFVVKTLSSFGRMACALAIVLAAPVLLSAKEPFYEGLGSYTRRITTKSPPAQRYFNQGLAFLHGFNHSAAIRSLRLPEWMAGM